MPDTTRTFLAIALPSPLASRLDRVQARLARDVPQGRWETAKPWHMTLAFLGDVPHSDILSVCQAASRVASGHSRFSLTLQGVGAFPDPVRPRVVWAGVSGPGLESLVTLQADLAADLAKLGFPGERQPFHPHVTLGRLRPGREPSRDLTGVFRQFDAWSTIPFNVEEVVTFSSTLTPGGPEYAPLGRSRLGAKKPASPT